METSKTSPTEPASAPLAPLSPGAPLLGNTLQFLGDTSGLLVDSYRKLGPVFRLRALWLKYTVIAGFEAREFIAQGLDDEYLSREVVFSEVGRQLGQADFVLGQSGEKHVRFRQLLSLAYSRQVASPFVPQFIAAVRSQSRSWQPGKVLSVMGQVQRLAFEQYCQVMCGKSLGELYRDCLMVTDYNMNVGGRVWPFLMYRTPWYQGARTRVLGLMWDMVRARRESPPDGRLPLTVMDTLMRVRDPAGNALTDDEVVCYSMYGFAGSCSYMSRLVGFMLYEILEHPDLHRQLTEEVDRAFGEGIQNAADVRRMRLLQAVYNESLRYHPVSQGMPFMAEKDFVYKGKRVSRGDVTVLSQVPMSFSECPFRNPSAFEPERCLEPRNEHRKEQAFHPFGIGHRTCTAMGLVELMSMTMVATLIHELRFTKSPETYQLKLEVKPLPAPDRNFGIKVLEHRAAGGGRPGELSEEDALAAFPGSDDPVVREALDQAVTRSFPAGTVILSQGDAAEEFHILIRGEAEVSRKAATGQGALARLREGECFGEIGLLQNVPRTATVTAGPSGADTLVLDRASFSRIIAASDLIGSELARIARRRVAASRLRDALPGIDSVRLAASLPEFRSQSFEDGAVILREGDPAEHFYLIVAGEVTVSRKNDTGAETLVATLGPGHYVGEVGLLHHQPRNASIRAKGPVSVLLTDRNGFEQMLRASGGTNGDLAHAMVERAQRLAAG